MAGTNIGQDLVGAGVGVFSYLGASEAKDLVAGCGQGGILAGVTGLVVWTLS